MQQIIGKVVNKERPSTQRRCYLLNTFAAFIYLIFTLLLITIEVLLNVPAVGKWPFIIASTLYLIYTFSFNIKSFKNLPLAILLSFVMSCFVVFLVVVIGVNFKFLIGGSI